MYRALSRQASLRFLHGLALAVLVAAGADVSRAEAAAPDGAAVELARQAWMPALLGRDVNSRLDVLGQMRADPELAREALLLAVTSAEPVPGRWRLMWQLGEFGRVEDIPVLLARVTPESDPLEQRFALAAARALYPAFDQPADLSPTVADFLFIQTRPPQAYEPGREGTYTLTSRVFDEYHRAGLPIDILVTLKPLRDRSYNDRTSLAQSMQRVLSGSEWRLWQDTLLAAPEPAPPRAVLEGLLRVRLQNPGDRPLLVRVGYGLWRGRFDSEPPTALIYAPPGGEGRLEQPVRIVAPIQERGVRIDLRLRELYQQPQPLYRKLIVPVQAVTGQ
jgi:hypothetical protein